MSSALPRISEQLEPLNHNMKGFFKHSHQHVHSNFAKNLREDYFLGMPFLAPISGVSGAKPLFCFVGGMQIRHSSPFSLKLPLFFLAGDKIRSFEKGLADRGGWRKEIPPTPQILAFFCPPFPYAPYEVGEHNSGGIFYFVHSWSPTPSRQPPPANPSRQPLFETFDKNTVYQTHGFCHPDPSSS